MHQLLPKAKRLAVLLNPANANTADATVKALGDAAPGLGLELLYFKASTAAEIDAAFVAAVNAKADALFIAPDGYFASRGSQLATLAARDRMPSSDFVRDAAVAGVLMRTSAFWSLSGEKQTLPGPAKIGANDPERPCAQLPK